MEKWLMYLFSQPRTCLFCYSPVENRPFTNTWKRVCKGCKEKLSPITNNICHVCGRNMECDEQRICLDCLEGQTVAKYLNRSVVQYSHLARKIVHKFKYYGQEWMAEPIGKWMAEVVLQHYRHEKFTLVTYVPIHHEKLKIRGYDQSACLAHVIGKLLNLPVVTLLIKKDCTQSQSKRKKQERLHSMSGAFRVNSSHCQKYSGSNVLIVDDVYTTGATLRECADLLYQTANLKSYAVTFAR